MRIEQLPVTRDKLGEGVLWDHRTGALYWLDHMRPSVRRFKPATGEVSEWIMPRTAGCACLTDDPDRLVVALCDAFAVLNLVDGSVEELVSVPQPRPAVRLSDGRADRGGAFVVGSAVTDFAGYDGAIYRLNPDLSVDELRPGMMLSNAICFQPDGGTMHFTDTRSGVVMSCDYVTDGPLASEPAIFADAREHGNSPDGATVDSEGGLWVAQIRTGELVRFAPDGAFDRAIKLPAPYVTSVTFGGENLDVLYATSIRETGMTLKSDHPQAGALFAVYDTGFKGVEEGIFSLGGCGAARGV